jgi:hypothetical protein
MKLLAISDTKNIDTFRRKINGALESVAAGYGSALPSAFPSDDGRLFYVGSQGYQNRNGTWVAL